jgi:hypothetical protein
LPGCGVLVAWGQYQLSESLQLRDGVNLYGGCVPAAQADPVYRSFLYAPPGGWPGIEGSLVSGVTIENFKMFGGSAGTSAASVVVQLLGGTGSSRVTINNGVIIAGAGGGGAWGQPNPAPHGAPYVAQGSNENCGTGGAADPDRFGVFSRDTWSWMATKGTAGQDGGTRHRQRRCSGRRRGNDGRRGHRSAGAVD